MNSRKTFIIHLFVAFVSLFFHAPAAEAASENEKINSLLSHIEGLEDATFIRNGSSYSAKNAVKFLRGKWDANKKDIVTANDFIEKAASKSSTTGKPYLIKLKGAAEVPCADYLKARLKKLETGS